MARILILADIHNDDRNLRAILKDDGLYDFVWCLGDVCGHKNYTQKKGYEGDAAACYHLLMEKKAICIRGNWEEWLLHPELDDNDPDQRNFNDELTSMRERCLNNGAGEWIIKLPAQRTKNKKQFTLVHGCIAPSDQPADQNEKVMNRYLFPERAKIVQRIFLYDKLPGQHMLFAHTHMPGYFRIYKQNQPLWKGITPEDIGREIKIPEDDSIHFLINPGSINLNRNRTNDDFYDDLPSTAVILDTGHQTFSYITVN
jgi:predicted phosphodiesterase